MKIYFLVAVCHIYSVICQRNIDIPQLAQTTVAAVNNNQPCPTGSSWPDVMACFQCVIDNCVNRCKSENSLPPWYEKCYDKTTWTTMTNLLGRCLYDTSPTCMRIPLGSAVSALTGNGGSRKRRQTATSSGSDFQCLGRCMFQDANECMRNCTDAPSTHIQDHPISSCFDKNQEAIDKLTGPFIECATRESKS